MIRLFPAAATRSGACLRVAPPSVPSVSSLLLRRSISKSQLPAVSLVSRTNLSSMSLAPRTVATLSQPTTHPHLCRCCSSRQRRGFASSSSSGAEHGSSGAADDRFWTLVYFGAAAVAIAGAAAFGGKKKPAKATASPWTLLSSTLHSSLLVTEDPSILVASLTPTLASPIDPTTRAVATAKVALLHLLANNHAMFRDALNAALAASSNAKSLPAPAAALISALKWEAAGRKTPAPEEALKLLKNYWADVQRTGKRADKVMDVGIAAEEISWVVCPQIWRGGSRPGTAPAELVAVPTLPAIPPPPTQPAESTSEESSEAAVPRQKRQGLPMPPSPPSLPTLVAGIPTGAWAPGTAVSEALPFLVLAADAGSAPAAATLLFSLATQHEWDAAQAYVPAVGSAVFGDFLYALTDAGDASAKGQNAGFVPAARLPIEQEIAVSRIAVAAFARVAAARGQEKISKDALLELGKRLRATGDAASQFCAERIYRLLSRDYYPYGVEELGDMYSFSELGEPTSETFPDYAVACKLYGMAGHQRKSTASSRMKLAMLFAGGRGVEQSDDRAHRWTEMAIRAAVSDARKPDEEGNVEGGEDKKGIRAFDARTLDSLENFGEKVFGRKDYVHEIVAKYAV